jgi:hypothetical protein
VVLGVRGVLLMLDAWNLCSGRPITDDDIENELRTGRSPSLRTRTVHHPVVGAPDESWAAGRRTSSAADVDGRVARGRRRANRERQSGRWVLPSTGPPALPLTLGPRRGRSGGAAALRDHWP